ncbi:MAG: hypothetical protein SV375_04240 [Thermodesulfobacteriota bacterium]|nr:hypothetical protein [Thermodesulfobacteriota bacterium]
MESNAGQKSFNFGFTHVVGMSFAVNKGKHLILPTHIGALGAGGIVFSAHYVAHLIQKF